MAPPLDPSTLGMLNALRGKADPRLPAMLIMEFEKERMEAEAHVCEVVETLKELGAPSSLIDAFVANALAAGRLAMVAELFRAAFGDLEPEGGFN